MLGKGLPVTVCSVVLWEKTRTQDGKKTLPEREFDSVGVRAGGLAFASAQPLTMVTFAAALLMQQCLKHDKVDKFITIALGGNVKFVAVAAPERLLWIARPRLDGWEEITIQVH